MIQPNSTFQLKNFWVMIPVPPETAPSELKALQSAKVQVGIENLRRRSPILAL